jgi:hypothetical protein
VSAADLIIDLGLDLALPVSPDRGRWSAERMSAYEDAVRNWCQGIISARAEIDRLRPGLHIGTREWCYLLENHGLHKDDFDPAERLITKCRKRAWLPLNIVDEDDSRAASNLEKIDGHSVEADARFWVDHISRAHLRYHPISFWENQDYYVEMTVEKASLLSLFDPVCSRYHVPILNTKGSWDLHARAKMLARFAHWQARGKECALLHCGDHDVHGIRISNHLHNNLLEMAPQMERLGIDVDIEAIVVERFGLNKDFIDANRLPWIEGLATGGKYTPDLDDPNHRKHFEHDVQEYIRKFGARKCEASALVRVPDAAEALCESAIFRLINVSRITAFERAERREQKKVEEAIKRILSERWSPTPGSRRRR